MPEVEAIDSLLEQIRCLSAKFPAEQRPHHFSFDIRSHPHRPVEVVVLGLNPGESVELAPVGPQHERVLEESSRSNFHEAKDAGPNASSKRWKTRINQLIGDRSISFSNVFFWSSRNSHQSFEARFKSPLVNHSWIPFCTQCNLQLIEAYRPKLVMLMGVSQVHRIAPLYGLTMGQAELTNRRHRLAIPLSGRKESWLAIKHPTGARLSGAEVAVLREKIDQLFARPA